MGRAMFLVCHPQRHCQLRGNATVVSPTTFGPKSSIDREGLGGYNIRKREVFYLAETGRDVITYKDVC